MRILYGVQSTGQGHISRARAMANALSRHDVEITWLFSGRPREQLFDVSPFGDFEHRRGLTFSTRAGQIRLGTTVISNNLFEFHRDVAQLDLSRYDMLITDFEPVLAWAAKRSGRTCIGLGHQYAFGPNTPMRGANWMNRTIMKQFSPVSLPIGFHWHPYATNVLPPILDLPALQQRRDGHVLVYLPFEDQPSVTHLLQQIPTQRFVQYANIDRVKIDQNVRLMPKSTETFKRDLASSERVICNSGFELISECLQWRKPLLTKPLAGQMEQLSNALALEQLGYALVKETLTRAEISAWLETPDRAPVVDYPDVAGAMAEWLVHSLHTSPQAFRGVEKSIELPAVSGLANSLWRQCFGPNNYNPDQELVA